MIEKTDDLIQYPRTCCCLCGQAVTQAFGKNTCSLCVKRDSVKHSNVPRKVSIRHCRDCKRFEKPPFVYAEWESQELLKIAISKIRGLGDSRIKFAKFSPANPERGEILLELVLSSDSTGEMDENVTTVVKICTVQCDDCKRAFTPHLWIAGVQLREKNGDGTNLRYIEASVMQDSIHNIIRDIKREEHGLDFSFSDRKDALKFQEFVESRIVSRSKSSKHLISHDTHSSKYNYKYETVIEIASIAVNDLVALPREICRIHGGIGTLNLVTKVSTRIHIIDVLTGSKTSISGAEYWKNPVSSICSAKQGIVCTVLDVDDFPYGEKRATNVVGGIRQLPMIYDVYLLDTRMGTPIHAKTILRLKPGDSVICCDLESMNLSCDTIISLDDVLFTLIPLKKINSRSSTSNIPRGTCIPKQAETNEWGNFETISSDISTENKKLHCESNSPKDESAADNDMNHSLVDPGRGVDISHGVCELMYKLEVD